MHLAPAPWWYILAVFVCRRRLASLCLDGHTASGSWDRNERCLVKWEYMQKVCVNKSLHKPGLHQELVLVFCGQILSAGFHSNWSIVWTQAPTEHLAKVALITSKHYNEQHYEQNTGLTCYLSSLLTSFY